MGNKPIIDIQIDDTAFKKFYDLFEEYSKKLEEMPDEWKKLDAAIKSTGKGLNKSSSSVNQSLAVAMAQTATITSALNSATGAQSSLGKATEKSSKHMARLGSSVATVAEGVFSATSGMAGLRKVLSSFGPVGAIAGVAGAAGLAVGNLALRSAGGVTSSARSAFGANLGYGQYKNATAQLSPFISNPGAVLQNIAAAQWTPADAGALGIFGVSPGQSTTAASAAVIRGGVLALRKSHNLMLPQVRFAESLAGLSDNAMISLANQKPGDLNAAIAAMQNPAKNKAQNVNGATISSDQKLVANWAASMNAAEAKFATALAPMNPIVTSFGASVATFAGAVNKIVQSVVGGAAPGTPGGPGGPPLTAANSQNATGLAGLQARLPIALGGLGNGPGGIGGVSGGKKISGVTSYAAVMKGFENAGYSTNFAAAMAAQAGSESGFGMNWTNTKNGTHAGLFQWSKARRDAILQGTGIDVWKDRATDDQIKAAVWELHNPEKNAAAKINAAAKLGPQYAGVAADNYYERSGDNPFYQAVRGAKANLFAAVGPQAQGLPASVVAVLNKLRTPPQKVSLNITNSTSARVSMSANAAIS